VFAKTTRTKFFNLVLCDVPQNLQDDMFAVTVGGIYAGADVNLPLGEVCDNVWIDPASLWTSAAAACVYMVSLLGGLARG